MHNFAFVRQFFMLVFGGDTTMYERCWGLHLYTSDKTLKQTEFFHIICDKLEFLSNK